MGSVRIALAHLPFPKSHAESVTLAEQAVADAAQRGAALICFPECYVPGYRAIDRSIAAPTLEFLESAWARVAAAAARARIAVILGTERILHGRHLITALVIQNDGSILGFQDKVQLDPSEDDLFVPGHRRHIFETGALKFGVVICHEGWRYPETVRAAAREGAHIVFHPHYTPLEEGAYRPNTFGDPANSFHEKAALCRAAENTCYFATVNCAQEGSGTTTAIVNPDGTLLADQPYGQPGLLLADIHLNAATGLLAGRYRPASPMPPPPAASGFDAIGNTPIVELRRIVPPNAARVFVKLEYFNPTGSYKDRMALSVMEGAERSGRLKPGMRVVEYTGGSTGSSLAMVCAVKGYEFRPISSNAFAREKLDTMQAFGGELVMVPSDDGRITPNLFDRLKAEAARQVAEPGVFYVDQFNNDDVMKGYTNIGREIIAQLGKAHIDLFCGAVGTGGMLTGVARALKAAQAQTRIVALEPAESPTLSTGAGGPHRVEGIGVGFWPPHLKKTDFDRLLPIPEAEARATARRLAAEEGIFAGTSSGLNVAAALRLALELGPGKTVVTVACDSGLKYLNGDLFRE